MKTCIKCKLEKPLTEFHKNGKDSFRPRCKCCENERKTLYRDSNREKVKKSYNTFYATHREEVKAQRKNNKQYTLSQALRHRVRDYIKAVGYTELALQLLGCSKEDFIKHLESKFVEGMSWDNYGDWHIDHIKPCASFDLTDIEQQKVCFHYTNLQPLWGSENLKKGSRLDFLNK